MTKTRWRAGIDVGLNSVGLAAVEVNEAGLPLRLLNMQSVIHDSGVGRDGAKAALTRRAISGNARRQRRLVAQRHKRLEALDRWITAQGWPIVDLSESADPYWPWTVRASLAAEHVASDAERGAMLSIALRHMARHRGWRSPWMRVEALMAPAEPSKDFVAMMERFEQQVGSAVPAAATPAQVVVAHGLTPENRIRTRGAKDGERPGLLGSRLHQSDHANELRAIAEMQRLSVDVTKQMIAKVFDAKSPKGSSLARIGADPLQRGLRRASKSTLAFQRYRIVSLLANLRIRELGKSAERPLSATELRQVTDYLWTVSIKEDPSWSDVARVLGVDREQLRGTASITEDGERASARPPVNVTDRAMRTLSVKKVAAWWQGASSAERDALVDRLEGDLESADESGAAAVVDELYLGLDDLDLAALEEIKTLPRGRAAYSASTLRRITERMLETGEDLHHARKAEFGLADDWVPPVDAIGAPVGNPAVDRVTKIVVRWLLAMEAEHGAPLNVNVEHVRAGFVSASMAREMDYAIQRRRREVEKVQSAMVSLGYAASADIVRREDRYRYQAFSRQNGLCLYCGEPIQWTSFEMDHIVPRKGMGSSNRRDNLAAVCRRCNRSKSNTPFALWAENCGIPGVSLQAVKDRIRHFQREPTDTPREHSMFTRELVARLSRKSPDEEIDGRSMESVAWMADELHRRIKHHFKRAGAETVVSVFRGMLTSEARKASGVEDLIQLIGGPGKSRLDRRHHAVDALVISLMQQAVATVLAQRLALRADERLRGADQTWKTFRGSDQVHQLLFGRWQAAMVRAIELLNEALAKDCIVVRQNLRLRLGDGKAHDDGIRSLTKDRETGKRIPPRRVGDELPVSLIDRAATPALWCALTRAPGFDPVVGLPADPGRQIVVNGTRCGPMDEITFLPGSAAAIAVRDGFAEIGDTIHHARIYRIEGKKPTFSMVRVFTCDLLRHRKGDLFAAELPPQSISIRSAEPKLRRALTDGAAEYLGWLVIGDELLLDMTEFAKGTTAVANFLVHYPFTSRWVLDGFNTESQLRLRPRYLASEGLEASADSDVRKTVEAPGWRVALNAVFGKGAARVVRRDTLGRPRIASSAHLPVSWQVGEM